MMRLLGVLVGSALAVAAMVVFVGIPEFTTESSVMDSAVITLPMRTGAAAPDAVIGEVQEEVPEAAPAAAAIDAPAEPVPDETPADTPTEPHVLQPAETLQWYAFWSPFRSEVAANGFVDQLQRVTGLDYRVVKVESGVFEVAFAYQDDQEITANLSQISAATGLRLPEG